MKQTFHELLELPSGNGTVSFSADSPENLRQMLYELRDETTKAIVRVEDEQNAQAWITQKET
jgi:hypothetical protein